MKVRYTIDALLHIAAIHSYIADRNPASATRVVGRIRRAGELLEEQPRIGHKGAAHDTCEWVVKGLPYVIVHEIPEQDAEVLILGIYHCAQLRPGQDSR